MWLKDCLFSNFTTKCFSYFEYKNVLNRVKPFLRFWTRYLHNERKMFWRKFGFWNKPILFLYHLIYCLSFKCRYWASFLYASLNELVFTVMYFSITKMTFFMVILQLRIYFVKLRTFKFQCWGNNFRTKRPTQIKPVKAIHYYFRNIILVLKATPSCSF